MKYNLPQTLVYVKLALIIFIKILTLSLDDLHPGCENKSFCICSDAVFTSLKHESAFVNKPVQVVTSNIWFN